MLEKHEQEQEAKRLKEEAKADRARLKRNKELKEKDLKEKEEMRKLFDPNDTSIKISIDDGPTQEPKKKK